MQLIHLVCLLSLLIITGSVRAFESVEHKHLGDLSIRVAIDYVQARKLAREEDYWRLDFQQRCKLLDSELRAFYRTEKGEVCDGQRVGAPSYGDLVSLVDYVLYPRKLFDAPEHELSDGIPRRFGHLNPRLVNGSPRNFTLDFAQATSANELHFQVAAIRKMVNLHREAVNHAANGALFAALSTNALADHFLHDMFAPGHITVNRENSHDAIALGMHDTANRQGADFQIDTKKFKDDLLPIMEFLRRNHAPERGHYAFVIEGVEPDERKLQQVFDDFSAGKSLLKIYGDGELKYHAHQQLFMLMIQVRGLLDVLDRCDGLCARNSLNEFIWYEYDERKPQFPPRAGLPYGEYVLEVEQLSQASNIFIISVGGEAPLSEFGSSRLVISAELAPLKAIGASDFLRKHTINRPVGDCAVLSPCNIAPVFGVTMVQDERFNAWGPNFRLIKAFPRIDLQVSAYWQYLEYDLDNPVRKSTWGMRLDTGFSLYTAFIGIGQAYFVNGEQDLSNDYVVSFGMAFGFPLTRLGLDW